MRVPALVAALLAASAPRAVSNLNGFHYGVANAAQLGRNFSLASRARQYVDVYTPIISSLYSQVQWSPHGVALPADLVTAFDGRVMNIVGYEFDIIRPADYKEPCVSSTSAKPVPCERTSVPSYEQYNHHYGTTVNGRGTAHIRSGIPEVNPLNTHGGAIDGWALVTDEDVAPHSLQAPRSQLLMMGNGAESRHTLKVFPTGYGALVGSPSSMTINPMIIDTNARGNHSSVAGAPQIPGRHGPVPRSSNVGPEEMYSGMMECPCTDAFPKKLASAMTLEAGVCTGSSLVSSAGRCFDAAASLGLQAKTNRSVHTATAPPGCYATAISGGFEIAFNGDAQSKFECGARSSSSPRRVALLDAATQGACDSCSVDIDLQPMPMPAHTNITGQWIDSGPLSTGAMVTVSYDPATKNYSAYCNGKQCGFAGWPTKVWGSGPVKVGPSGESVFWWQGTVPGTIASDFHKITWYSGTSIINSWTRWFPASGVASSIAGSYRVMVYGQGASANGGIVGQIWTVHGTNAAFTVVRGHGAPDTVCHVAARWTFLCPDWEKLGVTGAISADFNVVNFSNGVRMVRIDPASLSQGNVTVTMHGPSDVWYGAGFMQKMPVFTPGTHSGSAMTNTYAIIVLGNGTVQERKLGHHTAGVALKPASVTVLENEVVDGVRRVVVSRSMIGASPDHFTFTAAETRSLGLINAVGSGAEFGYHKAHSTAKLFYVDVGDPTCVCDMAPLLGSTSSQGTIGRVSFASNCAPQPLGQMLSDPAWANTTVNPQYGDYTNNHGVNPTCQLSAYRGGLKCCAGGTLLMDGEENRSKLVADADYDHYQALYRIYYEDATDALARANAITDTYWIAWWTEFSNGEHDVPPCFVEPCVYSISSNITGADLAGAREGTDTLLVHVDGHCHIGCLGMEMWNVDDPTKPVLICETKVDYGENDEAHNEMGYVIGTQPCIFGPEFANSTPPIVKTTTKLMSIQHQNNTHPRFGDMGVWEIRAAYRSY